MTPAVSILTTVYNGEKYLPESIDSVLAQRFEDFEYVIVDDGSTDGTPSLLAGLRDDRIRVVTLPRSGRGAALMAGLSACRAGLVAILDADDVAYPSRLAIQHALMTRHPEIAVLGGTCDIRAPNPPPDDVPIPEPRVVPPRELIARTPFAHSAVVIRRECAAAVGGYAADRPSLLDYDLWIRMAERGYVMARLDVRVAYHRIHAGQSFERRRRWSYLMAAFRERRRAARLFGERRLDSLIPLTGFIFGLIPVRIRMRVFRLSGE